MSPIFQKIFIAVLLVGPPTIALSQIQLNAPVQNCKDATIAEKKAAWVELIIAGETNPIFIGHNVLEFINQQCSLSSGEKLIKFFEPFLRELSQNNTLVRTLSHSIMRLVKMELALLNNPQWNPSCDPRVISPVEDILSASNFSIDSYSATFLTILTTEIALKEFTFKLDGTCEDQSKKDLIRSTLQKLTDFKNNNPDFKAIAKNFNEGRAGLTPQIRQSRQKLYQILYR